MTFLRTSGNEHVNFLATFITHYSQIKGPLPALFQSEDAYMYTCLIINETSRLLRSRACAYMGISYRIFRLISVKEPPERVHSEVYFSPLKFDQFEVHASTFHSQSLLILESLFFE
ncbi:UNVERIFIED_CONTAM: hypothetical protein RMT77_010669 [Armadillidium vulgare]